MTFLAQRTFGSWAQKALLFGVPKICD